MWTIFDNSGVWRGTTNDDAALYLLASTILAEGKEPVIIDEED